MPHASQQRRTSLKKITPPTDPWRWLEQRDDPAVLAHLEAENARYQAHMAPHAALIETLYQEILARIEENDDSPPTPCGPWLYYSRSLQGLAFPLHLRRSIDGSGAEEILLDENQRAAKHPFYEVGDFEISPNGQLLAWTEDLQGNRRYRLQLRHLANSTTPNRRIPIQRKNISSLIWANDNQTLFYVREEPRTQRAYQLWRHQLHRPDADQLIYTERDERFSLSLHRSRNDDYLVLTSNSHTTSEIRLLDANRPTSRWRRFSRRKQNIEYELEAHDTHFMLRINDSGPNYRLVRVPRHAWERQHWQEYAAHRDDTIIEGIDLWQHWQVQSLRLHGQTTLRITDLRNHTSHDIAAAEATHILSLDDLPDWHSPVLRYQYESLATPTTLYEYHPETQQSIQLKQLRVLSAPGEPAYDPQHYHCERSFATAQDGTPIPLSLIRHRDTTPGGPLWLEVYGAYGIANDPWFSSSRLSLLHRGWTFAIAHVRGGGELGKTWHDAGRLNNKPTTFTDYLACAHHLITQGYTQSGQILAHGASAGGLTVAASLNLDHRPFGAAILSVPFVDVLNTMLRPELPLTVGEYEEWGNPQKPRDYQRIQNWSPYDQVKPTAWPPILLEAGLHDSQVMYWEAAKYAAKLQTHNTGPHPILLNTQLTSGHSGSAGRYDSLHERAEQLAFALNMHSTIKQVV